MTVPWPPDAWTNSLGRNHTIKPASTDVSPIAESRPTSSAGRPSISKRKFSLAKLVCSRSANSQSFVGSRTAISQSLSSSLIVSSQNFSKENLHISEACEPFLAKITPHVEKVTGLSLVDLALEDLKQVPPGRRLSVLEEYVRISRKNCRVVDMLRVEKETRSAIQESVRRAREKLTERIDVELQKAETEEQWEKEIMKKRKEEYRLTLGMDFWGKKKPISWSTSGQECKEEVKDDEYSNHSSWRRSDGSSYARLVLGARSSFVDQVLEIVARTSGEEYDGSLPSPATAESFARIADEAGITDKLAPLTAAIVKAITPPQSRSISPNENTAETLIETIPHTSRTISTSPRHPFSSAADSPPPTLRSGHISASRHNPFASFLTEPSDATALELPLEIQLCYFAHNHVQDVLRTAMRQYKGHIMSAARIARDFLDKVEKPWEEVDITIECDGRPGAMRVLGRDEMVEIWARRFWERCVEEGW